MVISVPDVEPEWDEFVRDGTLFCMPRFGTRTLLIVFALVALWLSTFSGFAAAQDVRRSMLLSILVAAACLALYSRGRRRAYWAGFAIVMLLCGGLDLQRPLHRYVPDFAWQNTMGVSVQPYLAPAAPYGPSTRYYGSGPDTGPSNFGATTADRVRTRAISVLPRNGI